MNFTFLYSNTKLLYRYFEPVWECYKNGRHEIVTPWKMSQERDLYLYLCSSKYGKKSCIFRGHRSFLTAPIDTQ